MVNFQDVWFFGAGGFVNTQKALPKVLWPSAAFRRDRLTPFMYTPRFKQLCILGGLRSSSSVYCRFSFSTRSCKDPRLLNLLVFRLLCTWCAGKRRGGHEGLMKVSGLDSGSGQHCRNLYSVDHDIGMWPPYRCDWAEKLHFLTSHVKKEPM